MIIVQTTQIDPAGVDLDATFGLRADPFPGDTVRLPDGRLVLVVRRTFHALNPDNPDPDAIDLLLRVRLP